MSHYSQFSILMPSINCDFELLDNVNKILRDPQVSPNQLHIVIDGGKIHEAVKNKFEALGVNLYLLNRNVGVGSALNVGLKSISSQFIRRMDVDDEWVVGSINDLVISLLKDNVIVIGSCLVKKNGRRYKPLVPFLPKGDLNASAFLTGNPITHPTVCFNLKQISKVGGYSEKKAAEDFDLWLRFYLQGVKFFNTDLITVIYSRDLNTASKSLFYKEIVEETFESWFEVVGRDFNLDQKFLGVAVCRGINCDHSKIDIKKYKIDLIDSITKLRELKTNKRLFVNIVLRGAASLISHESKISVVGYFCRVFKYEPLFPIFFMIFTFQDTFKVFYQRTNKAEIQV